MKISYLTFMIRDMEKSLEFYREIAGLTVMRRFNPGMGEIAFLANAEGETMVELTCFAQAVKMETQGVTLSFFAGDGLVAVRDKAIQMGYMPSEVIIHPPKPAHFTVMDPDGMMVEFSA